MFENFKTEVLTADWQKKLFKDSAGYFTYNKTFLGKEDNQKHVESSTQDMEKNCDKFEDAANFLAATSAI